MRLILLLTKLILTTTLHAGWQENTIAAILVAEAGIDGQVGMECVAEVMLNRAKASRVSVISLANDRVFSSLRGTTPTKLYVKALREDKTRLQTALKIAETTLHRPEQLPRRVNGATHFCQTKNKPWWAEKMDRVALVKHHSFYRPKRLK